MNRSIKGQLATIIFFISCLILSCQNGEVEDPTKTFQRNIRSTEPLTPQAERGQLKVPPGFEVQLFASEPDIGKPLNMSFDPQGRMWVTQSYEYPFPDTTGVGRDKISILEDVDGDGTADKITTFADSLNIPIGLQVVSNGAIAYSIPNIWHLVDHDGDDRVDERKILYSGFQYDDTHGMVNNFVRSWDGWIHANHGFANTSTVSGSDGDTLVLTSGNTFRFRMDGSHLEFTTTGRVNPYGYAYDELGYTYSTDCHTSPIYQLIRGADYPHFGKKPTGIGFGPAVMEHSYGSTALAGLDFYLDTQFPAEFQRNFYYGDVVLSLVSRSSFEMHGTTPTIQQHDDFVRSEDPWFRPVDVKLGPDGALYVADFYNRIIGHYEVSLDHPGRDRQRGRIWRIVHTASLGNRPSTDWSKASLTDLLENLDHPNLPLRTMIGHQIVDRFGDRAINLVKDLTNDGVEFTARVQALWILYRLNAIDDDILQRAFAARNEAVRVHALRIAFEQAALSSDIMMAIRTMCVDQNPHVQRQAVMVLGKHPDTSQVLTFLNLLKDVDPTDTHFYYSIRQSLRDQLRHGSVMSWVASRNWSGEDADFLAEVLLGVESEMGARFLLQYLSDTGNLTLTNGSKLVAHTARQLSFPLIDSLIHVLQAMQPKTLSDQYRLFTALQGGLEKAGAQIPEGGKAWSIQLAQRFLENPVSAYANWQTLPLPTRSYGQNPWLLIDTNFTVGTNREVFLSSGPMHLVGNHASIMRSPSFKMPAALQFELRGELSEPSDGRSAEPPTNWVLLRSSKTDTILAREEINAAGYGKQISWSQIPEGQEVYLEIYDGSSRKGEYIAISDPKVPGLKFPSKSPSELAAQQTFACQIAAKYGLAGFEAILNRMISASQLDMYVRDAAAQALLSRADKESTIVKMTKAIDGHVHPKLKELFLLTLSKADQHLAWKEVTNHILDLPYQTQKELVMNIGQTIAGIDFLMDEMQELNVNPRLLAEPQISERMQAIMTKSQVTMYRTMLSEIKPEAGKTDELINNRVRDFHAATYSAQRGQNIFSIFCGICHQVNGHGGDIGPPLDGISSRGPHAVAEKILDPNRNVSKAFKTYTLRLKDGSIKSGLLRREEGAVLVFANEQGQEFSIEESDIAEKSLSIYTLMPNHFDQTIPQEDFNHLMTYLMELD